jgi:hypothetical protein
VTTPAPQTTPQPYQLEGEQAQVTLNGSGNGTARWTPGAAGSPGSGVGIPRTSGYSVSVTGVAVSVGIATGNTKIINEAQCSVFISYGVQSATALDFQGQTGTGSHGDTDSMSQTLRPGDWITAVWSGGDAGAVATMRILGTVNPPGV